MNDQESKQTSKLLLFFVAGSLLSLVTVLVFEARFHFHWMRDVSLVSAAVTSPGYFLYAFFVSGFAGLPGDPVWLRNILASLTNGFVYAGIAYLLLLMGVRSVKKQLVILACLLLAFSAFFLCMWEECFRIDYWV